MAHEYQSSTTGQQSAGALQDGDDLRPGGAPAAQAPPAEGEMVVEEVAGEGVSEAVDGGEATPEVEGAHAEVGADGAEAGEEYAEASAEQLEATPEAEESAPSDFRSLESFEGYGGEETAEAIAARAVVLPDAGAATEGGQEFLPIIASMAATVLPTLVSKFGPTIARGVAQKLSPAAKAILRRRRKGGDILSVIARLLETAEQQPTPVFGESAGTEAVDGAEALVEETTQMLEVIIGTDDRVRIKATTRVPWRRYCALRIYMPSGAQYRGTGFFIGPRTVATAGHCVYLHNQGGWARRIEVIPGANGPQRPFGQAVATTFRSTNGWMRDKKPACDYGCIVLPSGAFSGRQLGSFGFAAFSSSVLLAKPAVVAGYSGDKPFAELWGMSRRLKTVTPTQLIYEHDTMGGNSGGPVYIKRGGKRYVVGIHNYGASSANSATRVTASVFKNLKRWSRLGVAAPRPSALVGASSS